MFHHSGFGIGPRVAAPEQVVEGQPQSPLQDRTRGASAGHGEDEPLGRARFAMPPPVLDERRQGVLGNVLGQGGVRRSEDAVAEESPGKVPDGRFQVHVNRVPDVVVWSHTTRSARSASRATIRPTRSVSSRSKVRSHFSNDAFYARYSTDDVIDMYVRQATTCWPGVRNFITYAVQDDHDFILEVGRTL